MTESREAQGGYTRRQDQGDRIAYPTSRWVEFVLFAQYNFKSHAFPHMLKDHGALETLDRAVESLDDALVEMPEGSIKDEVRLLRNRWRDTVGTLKKDPVAAALLEIKAEPRALRIAKQHLKDFILKTRIH